MLAYGRLLRLSLAPSALADIAAGTVLGAGSWPSAAAPFVLMLSSSCVYHGGMALNDWADREQDARARPSRPLPSGAVRPSSALLLAVLLLAGGPALALLASPRSAALLGLVALLATVYDLRGRGPLRGPALLACCRAGNLGAGLALGSASTAFRPETLLAPLAYGLYVFLLSRLARIEDLDPAGAAGAGLRPGRSAQATGLALLVLGGIATFLAFGGHRSSSSWFTLLACAPLLLAALGASGLLRYARARAGRSWTTHEVQAAAGMALRRLLVASAALALGSGSPAGALVCAVILLGYPVSFLLRRVFPPT